MRCSRLLLLVTMVAWTACGDSKDKSTDNGMSSQTTCERGGVSYKVGDVISGASAGEPSCTCLSDGEIKCTGALDDDDAGVDGSCEREGETYAVGDVIPNGDAGSCLCLEGSVVGRCTGAL